LTPPSSPTGEEALTIERLKKRPDFLAAAKARNFARGAVVAQARDRADGSSVVRIGFTCTKRIGNAVVRNRAKRRLREAARIVAPLYARRGCDYVFIARGGTAKRAWAALVDDTKSALIRLAADPSDHSAPSSEPNPATARP